MGYLINLRHRHHEVEDPQPMVGTFALFATMVLAAVVVVFLGWLVTQ